MTPRAALAALTLGGIGAGALLGWPSKNAALGALVGGTAGAIVGLFTVTSMLVTDTGGVHFFGATLGAAGAAT